MWSPTYKPSESDFLKDVSDHKLTVIREDGLYRHIRFCPDHRGFMWFDIVTRPGRLCFCGDMGCYVFSRVEDMLRFFRGKTSGPLEINPHYWSQKIDSIDSGDRGVKKYDPEIFRDVIGRILDDIDASEELRSEVNDLVLTHAEDGHERAVYAAIEFDHKGKTIFEDFYEYDLTEYTHGFIWCCYAIVWAVRQYDCRTAESGGIGEVEHQ